MKAEPIPDCTSQARAKLPWLFGTYPHPLRDVLWYDKGEVLNAIRSRPDLISRRHSHDILTLSCTMEGAYRTEDEIESECRHTINI